MNEVILRDDLSEKQKKDLVWTLNRLGFHVNETEIYVNGAGKNHQYTYEEKIGSITKRTETKYKLEIYLNKGFPKRCYKTLREISRLVD